jgi:4-diphosphocytidyl-2-C-methyl-D-erythritol kinase
MILCPNAKINLGLEVVRKRPDGFHDIETLFVPAPGLSDVLEVVKADEPQLTTYGIPCDVPMEKNLCFKAFRLMQEQYGIGNVHIFLYKNIPMGAGLGGGSSDAAFTLLALNSIFELGLDKPRLAELAAQLGSDCPFFIYNQPMFATGRGEILSPYPLDLSDYRIEIITPGIHISTTEAYKGVDECKAGLSESKFAKRSISLNKKSDAEQSLLVAKEPGLGSEIASLRASLYKTGALPQTPPLRAGYSTARPARASLSPDGDSAPVPYANNFSAENAGLQDKLSAGIVNWRENVVNDFELYAFAKYPVLAQIKQQLYDRGAMYASMTGSGSAMYGIFKNL